MLSESDGSAGFSAYKGPDIIVAFYRENPQKPCSCIDPFSIHKKRGTLPFHYLCLIWASLTRSIHFKRANYSDAVQKVYL